MLTARVLPVLIAWALLTVGTSGLPGIRERGWGAAEDVAMTEAAFLPRKAEEDGADPLDPLPTGPDAPAPRRPFDHKIFQGGFLAGAAAPGTSLVIPSILPHRYTSFPLELPAEYETAVIEMTWRNTDRLSTHLALRIHELEDADHGKAYPGALVAETMGASPLRVDLSRDMVVAGAYGIFVSMGEDSPSAGIEQRFSVHAALFAGPAPVGWTAVA